VRSIPNERKPPLDKSRRRIARRKTEELEVFRHAAELADRLMIAAQVSQEIFHASRVQPQGVARRVQLVGDLLLVGLDQDAAVEEPAAPAGVDDYPRFAFAVVYDQLRRHVEADLVYEVPD